ncbi:RICIN domain-containing protein [Streptomyces sp. NBC_00467]|uniref:RICIN domain-containing protein n=1 Tax=Streptomyces sp. NBC_00467 TaxID=2975752 RepID=UPI002E1842BE
MRLSSPEQISATLYFYIQHVWTDLVLMPEAGTFRPRSAVVAGPIDPASALVDYQLWACIPPGRLVNRGTGLVLSLCTKPARDGTRVIQDLVAPSGTAAGQGQRWCRDFTGQITCVADASLLLGLNGEAIGSSAVTWRREERIRTLTTWRTIRAAPPATGGALRAAVADQLTATG